MTRIDLHTILLIAILVFVVLMFFGVGVVNGGPGF
jgi:hypothetical protein